LGSDDIVKGYEHEKDKFVVVDEDELNKLSPDRTNTIAINSFVSIEQIDPILFDRTYYLSPAKEASARQGYVLLMEAMKETGKAAIARFVLWGKENLCVVRPHEGVLVLDLLFWSGDIRPKGPVLDMLDEVYVSDDDLSLAVQLVEGLESNFEHSKCVDRHSLRVREYLAKLSSGKKPTAVKKVDAPAPTPDLMAALKASVAAIEEKSAPKRAPAKRKTKTG
jgi:DNA end-binding protein Ku